MALIDLSSYDPETLFVTELESLAVLKSQIGNKSREDLSNGRPLWQPRSYRTKFQRCLLAASDSFARQKSWMR
jgi:hypothetical protein